MTQIEYKTPGLCVISCDGSFRNRKMYNRVQTTTAKAETPKWFQTLKFSELTTIVNEIIENKAYIEYNANNWVKLTERYGEYVYFVCEKDAMAFKLKWN